MNVPVPVCPDCGKRGKFFRKEWKHSGPWPFSWMEGYRCKKCKHMLKIEWPGWAEDWAKKQREDELVRLEGIKFDETFKA